MSALLGSRPASGHTVRGASVVPPGLFTSLVKIDRKLAKLIDAVPKELPGPLIRQMTAIANDKRTMVDQYFADVTYGVKFSEVFRALDCLDRQLGTAVGRIAEDPRNFDESKVTGAIELGKKCKQRLEDELHQVAETAPPSLFTYAFSGLTISWDGPNVPNVGRTHVMVTFSGAGCGNAQSSRWAGTFQVQSAGVPPTIPWGGTFTGSTPTLVYTWNTKDSGGTVLGEVQTRLVLDTTGLTMKVDPVQTGDIANLTVGAATTVVSKSVASCP